MKSAEEEDGPVPQEIEDRDNVAQVFDGITVADAKVVIQVIDRLLSVGRVSGQEVLPVAIVRQKFVDIIKRYSR